MLLKKIDHEIIFNTSLILDVPMEVKYFVTVSRFLIEHTISEWIEMSLRVRHEER
jgi:hypothetical protein